jgi:hypothetical protein
VEANLTTSGERRRARRLSAATAHGILSIRIRPGHHAVLLDVSACGARVETSHRLAPGSMVELQMDLKHERATVRGRITRCVVAGVRASSMSYHGAIVFERQLPWFAPEHGHATSDAEQRSGLPAREGVTRLLL